MTDVKRIAVFGPESTGKTTLARRLATHFGEPWSIEYSRRFWDDHDATITAADLDAIARGQIAGEDAAAAAARRVCFCDTELLTCVLWDDLLFRGSCPPWAREEADRRARRFTLYLLCATDVPFEPDPQRCFPDPDGRAMCMRLWRETLTSRGLPFVEIHGGDFESRALQAMRAVESVLGA